VITGERGERTLTRHGLEEYLSDCVILLDHRVIDQISTRQLRIIKYRGTAHSTNEYPFLIGEDGISLLPITSAGLHHQVSSERISTGITRLDTMLDGRGYYRGSTVLVSGTAGTGKSSVAAHFAHAVCQRGEGCLYIAFEESPGQIIRNMRSIGLDLELWVKKGLLHFHATRATTYGLEMHLLMFHKLVQELKPWAVVFDPIGSLIDAGSLRDATIMVARLIDFLKVHGITVLMTDLTSGGKALEKTNIDISSVVDSWLLLRDIELSGERNRAMYVLKSRGMAHSNQIREFLITGDGIDLVDVYTGPEGVLTGSARLSQEARERDEILAREQEMARKQRERERKREALEARIAATRKEFEIEDEEAQRSIDIEQTRERVITQDRQAVAASRQADVAEAPIHARKSREVAK
jgi:circadian clock protein KaiC